MVRTSSLALACAAVGALLAADAHGALLAWAGRTAGRAAPARPEADRATHATVRRAFLAEPIPALLAACLERCTLWAPEGVPALAPRSPPLALDLELETRPGQIRIADAGVRGRGLVSQSESSCACKPLRGLLVAHPGAAPGRRLHMLLPLPPRGPSARPAAGADGE